mmetsp:Transcript_48710/g.55188  ORF Transcript_48710/g.55188 Transcript_48710/m.55188 type:complete len:429 (+) Transcript_48710:955-2241(+)
MKPKNSLLNRFVRTGYHKKFPRAVEDVLRIKSPKRKHLYFSKRPPTYLKGVGRDGNFYRLKIPPRKKRGLPNIPKLPTIKILKPPKPFSPLPPPSENLRVLKWLQENLPILVLNFGSCCTLLAFTRSDIIELRCLSVTGNFCFVAFSLRQKIITWPHIFWSSLFASVNSYKIYEIFEERNASVSMTKDEEKVYVDFFMPHGVTPKQFQRIEQSAEIFQLKKDDLLVRKGYKPDRVYLIVEGSTDALVLGRRLTAASTNSDTKGDQKEGGDSGAWAGEMAFLKQFWEKEQKSIIQHTEDTTTNNEEKDEDDYDEIARIVDSKMNIKSPPAGGISSFDVFLYSIIAAEDCTIMSWSHKEMEALMKSSIDLRSALTRAMSSALVGKVVNLTISRSHNTKIPWSVWLKDWKTKDGSSVEVDDDHFRLAEDKS